ncbi:MAG TPA: 4Fe-4S ferredoxin, partial [Desulfitobacterium dehalogenans]|nr:4Fe-4S ferredoxin [Desulfitobacterium dehalogenans]
CVDACPMRALEWGELEDLKAKHGDSVSELPLLPVSSVTKPALLIKAKNNAKQKDFKEKEI